jgi:hypothetical protein
MGKKSDDKLSGSSSFGRAIAFQAIGGRFEPGLPLRIKEPGMPAEVKRRQVFRSEKRNYPARENGNRSSLHLLIIAAVAQW